MKLRQVLLRTAGSWEDLRFLEGLQVLGMTSGFWKDPRFLPWEDRRFLGDLRFQELGELLRLLGKLEVLVRIRGSCMGLRTFWF